MSLLPSPSPSHRPGGRLRRTSPLICLLALALLAALPLGAQGADSLFQGFQPSADYVLEVDGELDRGAEIYYQQRIPAFLVLPSKLSSPLLLVARTKAVQSVHIMKIAKKSDGSLDLMADAVFASKGQFEIDGTSLLFAVDGTSFVLRDKPPLLGLRAGTDLETYSESYQRLSDSYSPADSVLAALRAQTREVHVRVYFGTWCPFCQRYVPRMMKVADEIAGSKVKIDFYGLPRQINEDPVARQANVSSVPTAVVYVDGKEAGRLQSEDWRAPERALEKLLGL